MQSMIFVIYLSFVDAFQCIMDRDCRISDLPNSNSRYCVNNTCQLLKPEGFHCKVPEECASYSYYGPLACSSICKSNKECFTNFIENSVFCCKAIPKLGECNINRPGYLNGCASSHVCEMNNGVSVCVEKKRKILDMGSNL